MLFLSSALIIWENFPLTTTNYETSVGIYSRPKRQANEATDDPNFKEDSNKNHELTDFIFLKMEKHIQPVT